jgi:hypothetical protein
VGGGGDKHDPDFDAWDGTPRVNLGGVLNGTKIIAPLILKQGEASISSTEKQGDFEPQRIAHEVERERQ